MIEIDVYDEENETTIFIQIERTGDTIYTYKAQIMTDSEEMTEIKGEFHSIKPLSSLELIEKVITFTRWENIE